jgi:hypothetical protein
MTTEDLDRAEFEERYAIAADATGALAGPDELDEAWDDYRSGAWDRLLAEPTPENAVHANRLAGSIAELLDDPAPDRPGRPAGLTAAGRMRRGSGEGGDASLGPLGRRAPARLR